MKLYKGTIQEQPFITICKPCNIKKNAASFYSATSHRLLYVKVINDRPSEQSLQANVATKKYITRKLWHQRLILINNLKLIDNLPKTCPKSPIKTKTATRILHKNV